jgi:KUP system potassium uptake protein
VLGILSLIVWTLTMVVTVKYLTFVMRADNRGEGGIMALLALVPRRVSSVTHTSIGWLAAIILLGAGLLYGDGLITPAISVLSAVEGLEVATDKLKSVVVPITCVVLAGLFLLQKRGTAGIGKIFGPVMLVWFGTLAVLGVVHLVDNPSVLWALNPYHAVRFFVHHKMHGLIVLGAVVLCVTGGEALYADMGHFGARAIRLSWYTLVMPSLILNYFGQGAVIIAHPERATNPFYALVPQGPLTYALTVLAAVATVIASQALISGVYSLTNQAIQLGYFPRVTVRHTSSTTEGQIYIPEINWGLAIGCIALVIAFKNSSNLAAAYGVAVTGTMVITSIAYYVVLRRTWKWTRWVALPVLLLFLCFDIPYFGANLIKFFDGGYIPLLIGAAIFLVMVIWKRGRSLLAWHYAERATPLDAFLANLQSPDTVRVPGTCVFMASSSTHTPPILTHHLRHNHVLHQTVILLTVLTEHRPRVPSSERVTATELGHGVWRVVAHYGFFQEPNVPLALRQAASRYHVPIELDDATYYIGRETLLATSAGRMGRWSELFFAFLSRNALGATAYFRIPPNRVVELGMQIDL